MVKEYRKSHCAQCSQPHWSVAAPRLRASPPIVVARHFTLLHYAPRHGRSGEWLGPDISVPRMGAHVERLKNMAQAKPEPAKDRRTRVLLVDDHAVVRFGMAQLINRQSD